MRFAHISDLHLCQDPGNAGAIRTDVQAFVVRLARDITAIADVLDFVILSGDLTDDGDPDSFGQVERAFAGLGLPIYTVPGNHDGPKAYFDQKQASDFLAECDISDRLVDLGDVRLLGLNTCVENETTGAVTAGALDLLTREFGSTADSDLIVVMHHPPFQPGLRAFDEISHLHDGDKLAQLLQTTRKPPLVLCGHVHRPYFARWHGATCFTAGSPAGHFAGDLPFGDAPLRATDEQYSYFVHALEPGGNHSVTTRAIGQPV